ncbi:MAG: phosphoglucosamine mutase [Clostridia bacterium]
MRKYFGTDGIRRIANTQLSPELVFKVAKASAYVLAKHNEHSPTILIGRDTRISGTLIESAMIAGFLSYGADVKVLGVVPTPTVAYLTKKINADAGVVISASHNTFEFNGIKFFSSKGMKISDDIEEEIEEVMDSGRLDELTAVNENIGISENNEYLIQDYIDFIVNIFKNDIKSTLNTDFNVAIDVSNGATYKVAQDIFKRLNINYKIINNTPNGININKNCGSTHLNSLKEYVVKNAFDLGIAYDGDGDRCLLVDEKGREIDGDRILAIAAKYLKSQGKLKNNTLVATVMSNLGLNKFSQINDLNFIQTKVGDRYVLEEMLKNEYNIGGEQSGHVIFLDYNPTGDGILTSLMIIKILFETKKIASKLFDEISIYPQVLINAKVNNAKKNEFEKDAVIRAEIEQVEKEFDGQGRVLIRASGTEPLVRVMIEGKDQEYITQKANSIAELIEERLK